MIIEIYGKQNCGLCESAKKKVAYFLSQWDLATRVQIVFRDMETEEGAAEGDFFDVHTVPSVLLKPRNDPNRVIARWDGEAPPSEELHRRLCA